MSKKRIDTREAPPLRANPFAALAEAAVPAGSPSEPAPSGPPESVSPTTSPPRRALVRYQRKGRGGKEVTLVERLGLAPAELDAWCGELKRALGCGGQVEDDTVVLSGDQRSRLPALLRARGVARVTTG